MDYSPSAPPPSYDEVVGNSSQQNYRPKTGYENQSPQRQHNYNAGIINLPHQQQPVIQQTQIQPNVVQLQQQHHNETQTNVIIVQGPPIRLGHFPTTVVCPSCHRSNETRVVRSSSWVTHSMAFMLFITGLAIFSCVPYCMTPCKNTAHYCKTCGKYLGTHQFGT